MAASQSLEKSRNCSDMLINSQRMIASNVYTLQMSTLLCQ